MISIPFNEKHDKDCAKEAPMPRRRCALASLFVVGLIAGCGAGGSPPATGSATPAAVLNEVSEPAPGGDSATTETQAARTDPSPSGAEGLAAPAPGSAAVMMSPGGARTPFVASITVGALNQPTDSSRSGASSSTPLRWLDVQPPVGVAGAPVIVVIPGAVPGPDQSMQLSRGLPRATR